VNTGAKTPAVNDGNAVPPSRRNRYLPSLRRRVEVMSALERVVQERGLRVKRILEIGRIRWIVKPVSGAFRETTFLLFMGQRVFFSGRPRRSGRGGACVLPLAARLCAGPASRVRTRTGIQYARSAAAEWKPATAG
jgi:hypothetical protein